MSKKQFVPIALFAALAASSSAAVDASNAPNGTAHRCARGSVHAIIAGKHTCLRAGARCRRALDRQYHRYGFHCHNGRLTRAARTPTPPPPAGPVAGRVVATIPVAEGGRIAIGDDAVWAASFGSRSVVKIDPQTNQVIATVRIGSGSGNDMNPGGVIAAGAGAVWVAGDTGHNVLYRVDPTTARVVATVRVGADGGRPNGLVVAHGSVWASDSHGGSVVRIDPATNREIARINVVAPDDVPRVMVGALGIAAGDVWVNVVGFNSAGVGVFKLVRIDAATNRVEAELETTCGFIADDGTRVLERDHAGTQPAAIALEPSAVWVANSGADSISRVDPQSAGEVATINVARSPRGIALGANAVWASAFDDDAVSRVTGSSSRTIAVGDGPLGIAFGAGSVWVANSRDGTVSRIDPDRGTVMAKIRVGHRPQGITVGGGAVWVTVAP